MGEEVTMSDYNEDSVHEWEIGLPNDDELPSLSQSLIPKNLATAFIITPERIHTIHELNHASETTLSSLLTKSSSSNTEEEDRDGSNSPTEVDESGTEDPIGKSSKRPRLVWTPQLHKRFVDVVAHLGITNAVPKTIMQLMNVEGLTRENVASHLQKYRLYLKRMQGLTTDGPSSSDKLFSSTPVPPQSFQDNVQRNGTVVPPMMMQMPVYAHHMGMQVQGYHHQNHGYDDNHHNHNYHRATNGSNPYTMQQNKFGSMASYPPVGGGSANEN